MITCYFENNTKAVLRHISLGVLVVQDDKVLLVKRSPGLSEQNKYGLPGGYMTRDETITQGALRELKEETGYNGQVDSLFIINSNPVRPHEDKQNVDIIFLGTVQGEPGAYDWEQTEVTWFPLTALPPKEQIAFDHGLYIQKYIEFRTTTFPLPLINPEE